MEKSQLLDDLDKFEDGLKKVCQEGAQNLSGGQRARVNIARTLYQEAEIYIFDDPLAALDASVSKKLFSEAIQDFLSGKTRIIATHSI